MKSSWDTTKESSNYHFDPQHIDQETDVVRQLGKIIPNESWHNAVAEIIDTAKPSTWATRGYKGQGLDIPPEDLAAEEYDLTRVGMPVDLPITHLSWAVPDVFQSIVDDFGLIDCMPRLHVQMPGEMWNLHLDKLQKWCPENPHSVMRIFIALTDWQMGQFYQFGNWNWHQWQAGDIMSFDWQNIPHCTANAGHCPRVTLQITGVRTEKTQEMLNRLQSSS